MKLEKFIFAAVLASMSSSLPPAIYAQDKEQAVTVVTHVDIIPSAYLKGSEENAARLLRAQETATLHDVGVVAYSVFQQTSARNHFTIVETWRDLRSYEVHECQTHTIQFRNGLQPFLGAPLDAREHQHFR